MDSLYAKRQKFVKRLRREARDQQTSQRRKVLFQFICNYKSNMKTQQQIVIDRQNLQSIAIQIRGEPNQEWVKILMTIRSTIDGFTDYSFLVESGILKQICLVFKENFSHLQLASLAARILNSVICDSKDSSTSVVRMLVQYDLIDDLMKSIVTSNLQTTIEELHLMGNMVGENGYIRNKIAEKGWTRLLTQLLNTPNLPQQINQLLVWLISNTVLHYKKKQYNLSYLPFLFTDHLIKFFRSDLRSDHKKMALSGLYSLSKLKQSNVCKSLIKQNVIKDLLEIIKNKQQTLKGIVWKLLYSLTRTKDLVLHNALINEKIFDVMNNALTKNPKYYYRNEVQKILVQMSSASSTIAESLIGHPLFLRSIQKCQVYVEQKTRHENMQLVLHVLSCAPSYYIQNLIEGSRLLQNTIDNVNVEVPEYIIGSAIQLMYYFIQAYQNVFSPNGINKLIANLESSHQFTDKLTKVLEVIEDKDTEKIVQKLLDKISQHYGG